MLGRNEKESWFCYFLAVVSGEFILPKEEWTDWTDWHLNKNKIVLMPLECASLMLPWNGCEVTALSMLLQHMTDKNELADELDYQMSLYTESGNHGNPIQDS